MLGKYIEKQADLERNQKCDELETCKKVGIREATDCSNASAGPGRDFNFCKKTFGNCPTLFHALRF